MVFSQRIQHLIDSLRCLPGVGPKSAQRMAFHLLERHRDSAAVLATAIQEAIVHVGNCQQCRMLSESELCQICQDPRRDQTHICIVETPADVIAIEQTASFQGTYFVLMGRLSPLDGIGPTELGITDLLKRIQQQGVKELILATNPTVEGDATAHYIADQLEQSSIICSRIALGIPLGGEIEYLDGGTVARALASRSRLSHTEETNTG